MAVNPLSYLGSGGTSLDYRGGMGSQGEDELSQIKKGARTAGVSAADSIPIKMQSLEGSPTQSANPGISVDPNKHTPVTQTPTFTQMRDNGLARPAPPPLPAPALQRAATPVLQSQDPAARDRINASVKQLLDNPSGYGPAQMQDQMDRFSKNLDAQAKQGYRHVDEKLAGRGFYDGTEAARALGDYTGQLDRQRRDYAGNLAVDAAQRFTADRTNALSAATQATGAVQNQDLNAANFKEGQRQYDDTFAQGQQDAELRRQQVLRSIGMQEDQTYAGINSTKNRDIMNLLEQLGSTRVSG